MPFSLHSHSGQFCRHAKGTLESMVQTAISRKMRVYALTEHMPRDQVEDLYPEEILEQATTFDLFKTFASYYDTALLLRGRYAPEIQLLVGFEAEYIRPSSIEIVRGLQQIYKFDFFVGSVHHVNTIPIDFDRDSYERALASCSDEEGLFEMYFEHQYEMLTNLRPAVVAHFDLIRLMARDPTRGVRAYGEAVWAKAVRNLEFVKSYNGLVELNSASLRKGWETPYPGPDICLAFISLNGRFTLSDDAHCNDQVGLNYDRTLEYVKSLGIAELCYLERLPMGEIAVDVLDACAVRTVNVEALEAEAFWTS